MLDVQVIVSVKACSTTSGNYILISRLHCFICIEVGKQSVNDYFGTCIQFCTTMLLSCFVFLWFRLSSFVVVSGFYSVFMSLAVIAIGSEPKEFPWFNSTCYIWDPFPCWYCRGFVTLCTFLVEGMSTLHLSNIFKIIQLSMKSGSFVMWWYFM